MMASLRSLALTTIAAALVGQSVQAQGSLHLPTHRLDEHVWVPHTTTLQTPRTDASATTVENSIYIIGGCAENSFVSELGFTICNSILDTVEEYLPLKDEITALDQPMPNPRYRHFSGADSTGKIFAVGGLTPTFNETTNEVNGETAVPKVDVFDTTTNTWSSLTEELPERLGDGAGFIHNDVIYYAGGWFVDDGYKVNGAVYQYDIKTSVWSSDTSLNIPRGDAHAVVLGHYAYVYGGFDGNFSPLSTMERLNLNAPEDGWQLVEGHSADPRGDAGMAVLGDKIVIIGGEGKDASGGSFPRRGVELYEPGFGWFSGGELYVGRFRFPAASFGDSVFVFGGEGSLTGNGGSRSISDRIDEFIQSPTINDIAPIHLHGSGTTNPSKYFLKAMEKFQEGSRAPLFMSYRAIGSGAGQTEFTGYNSTDYQSAVDFASGDIPLRSDRFQQLNSGDHKLIHIPFTSGAVAIFLNIPDIGTQEVKLSPCTAAKVFTAEIKRWNDQELVADNDFLRDIDQPITVLHRTRSSSSTSGVSTFLKASCESVWTLGASSVIEWPADTTAVEGSDGMADGIISTPYSIGYIDAGHGHRLQLQEAAIKNARGQFVNSKEGKVGEIVEGAFDSLPAADEDWDGVNLINSDVDGAFPIVLLSYFYVRVDQTGKGQTAALLRAFIDFTLSDDGQDMLQNDFRFSRLPTAALTKIKESVDQHLLMPTNYQEFYFETNTDTEIGHNPYTISNKRQSFGIYERSILRSQIQVLETKLAASEVKIEELSQGVSGSPVARDDRYGLAALIIALAGLLVALYSVSRTRQLGAKEVPLTDDFHSRNNSADPIRGVEMNQV